MELPFHYITDLLATLIGVELYHRSRQTDSISDTNRILIIIGALVGALIGSRLIAALENPALFTEPPSLFYYYANKTIVGGIAGGILGIELIKKMVGITVRTGDRTLVPLAVAIIIGRVGCFVAGVQDGTVGGTCNYFWCLEQGDGLLRHPNSLYEILFILLFLVGYVFAKHLKPHLMLPVLNSPGAFFRVFIVLYFALRFGIEFLKDIQPLLWGLNSIQLVCLAFILWYGRDIVRIYKSRKAA